MRMGALSSVGAGLLGVISDVFQPIQGFSTYMAMGVAAALGVFCVIQAMLFAIPPLRNAVVGRPWPQGIRGFMSHYWGVPMFGFLLIAASLLGTSAWLSKRYAQDGGYIAAIADPRKELGAQNIAFKPKDLLEVANGGDVENVRRFLDGGMRPDVQAQGAAVIWYVIARKSPNIDEILALFLDHGLDVNKKVRNGSTSTLESQQYSTLLETAMTYKYVEAIEFLVGRGATADMEMLKSVRLKAASGDEFSKRVEPLITKAAGAPAQDTKPVARDDNPLRGIHLGMTRAEVTAAAKALGLPAVGQLVGEDSRVTFGEKSGSCIETTTQCMVALFGGMDARLESVAFYRQYHGRVTADTLRAKMESELGKPAGSFSYQGFEPHDVRWPSTSGKVTVLGWGKPFTRERKGDSVKGAMRNQVWPIEAVILTDTTEARLRGFPSAEVFVLRIPGADADLPSVMTQRSPC